MRMLALIFFGLSLIVAAGDAQAQGRCKDGTASTITGTIDTIQQFRPEPGVNIWVLKGQGKFSGNCQVEQIWGNGQAPASCSKGKKFSATGKALDADSFWMLQTDKITCG
jgi:hypothetical protein